MSVDPLPGSLDDPQSLNRYSYVRNDSVNLVDPSGLCSLSITYNVHIFVLCTGDHCVVVGGWIEITSANIVGVLATGTAASKAAAATARRKESKI